MYAFSACFRQTARSPLTRHIPWRKTHSLVRVSMFPSPTRVSPQPFCVIDEERIQLHSPILRLFKFRFSGVSFPRLELRKGEHTPSPTADFLANSQVSSILESQIGFDRGVENNRESFAQLVHAMTGTRSTLCKCLITHPP
jgi:hypothetical protein